MSTTYTQAELSAKTVKDLKAILSELKLSGEGKKADLVTRILEHQGGSSSDAGAGAASSTPAAATTEASAEPASSSSAAEAAAISGGAVTSTAGLSAAGTGEQTTDGNAATDAPAAAATEETAKAKEEEKLPLPATTDKNDEAERRLNRLKRFGNPDDIAKIERMEKFGTKGDVVNEKSISALDSELSKKRPRTEKAGPQKGADAGAKNQNGKPDFKRQKSGNGKPAAANGKGPQSKSGAKAAPPALSPEEEEKRRKRAERFNAAS